MEFFIIIQPSLGKKWTKRSHAKQINERQKQKKEGNEEKEACGRPRNKHEICGAHIQQNKTRKEIEGAQPCGKEEKIGHAT